MQTGTHGGTMKEETKLILFRIVFPMMMFVLGFIFGVIFGISWKVFY